MESSRRKMTLEGNLDLHKVVESTAAAAKSLQSWPTLCDPIDGSPPGKNTGVSCHFLLQCVKVKVKSLSHV